MHAVKEHGQRQPFQNIAEFLDRCPEEAVACRYPRRDEKVAKELGIYFSYLRYRAFYMNKHAGFYEHTHMQHRDYTIHGSLIMECREKLEKNGYTVLSEQSEVRRFMIQHGSRGNPDLVAYKSTSLSENDNEVLLVKYWKRKKHLVP